MAAMDRPALEDWVARYVRAWESNDPDDIRGLFTEDARYYTAPHREPWSGADAIVEGWLGRKDEPGDWTFDWEVLAICQDIGFVRGVTAYRSEAKEYSNLWEIRLADDGRCTEYVEWWMETTT